LRRPAADRHPLVSRSQNDRSIDPRRALNEVKAVQTRAPTMNENDGFIDLGVLDVPLSAASDRSEDPDLDLLASESERARSSVEPGVTAVGAHIMTIPPADDFLDCSMFADSPNAHLGRVPTADERDAMPGGKLPAIKSPSCLIEYAASTDESNSETTQVFEQITELARDLQGSLQV